MRQISRLTMENISVPSLLKESLSFFSSFASCGTSLFQNAIYPPEEIKMRFDQLMKFTDVVVTSRISNGLFSAKVESTSNSVSSSRFPSSKDSVLVMMPGYGAGAGLFVANTELANAYESVVVADWLGVGGSPRPEYTPTNFDESVSFFIDSLENWRRNELGDKKIHLLGHSLGGFLSAHYALKYPDAVEHLILASPAALSIPHPIDKVRSSFKYPQIADFLVDNWGNPSSIIGNPSSFVRHVSKYSVGLSERLTDLATRRFSRMLNPFDVRAAEYKAEIGRNKPMDVNLSDTLISDIPSTSPVHGELKITRIPDAAASPPSRNTSTAVSSDSRSSFHSALSSYLHAITIGERASGELALGHLLAPFAYARRPLSLDLMLATVRNPSPSRASQASIFETRWNTFLDSLRDELQRLDQINFLASTSKKTIKESSGEGIEINGKVGAISATSGFTDVHESNQSSHFQDAQTDIGGSNFLAETRFPKDVLSLLNPLSSGSFWQDKKSTQRTYEQLIQHEGTRIDQFVQDHLTSQSVLNAPESGNSNLEEKLGKNQVGKGIISYPITLLYGEYDWMSGHAGFALARRLRNRGVDAVAVKVPLSGHHLYLEQYKLFDAIVASRSAGKLPDFI